MNSIFLSQITETIEIAKITNSQNFPIVVSVLLLIAFLFGVGWIAKTGLKEFKDTMDSVKKSHIDESEKTRKVIYSLRDVILQLCFRTGQSEIAIRAIEQTAKESDNNAVPLKQAS